MNTVRVFTGALAVDTPAANAHVNWMFPVSGWAVTTFTACPDVDAAYNGKGQFTNCGFNFGARIEVDKRSNAYLSILGVDSLHFTEYIPGHSCPN